jgi:hypothetical protein
VKGREEKGYCRLECEVHRTRDSSYDDGLRYHSDLGMGVRWCEPSTRV